MNLPSVEDVVIKEDIRQECLVLMKKLGVKLKQCVIVAHCYPEKRTEMCENGIKIVRQACDVFEVLELTK